MGSKNCYSTNHYLGDAIMRFSLRNQQKIKDSLGEDYLNLLLASLEVHFKTTPELKRHRYATVGYDMIHVPNIQPKTDSCFEFAIIKQTFDVLNLAYYSAIG